MSTDSILRWPTCDSDKSPKLEFTNCGRLLPRAFKQITRLLTLLLSGVLSFAAVREHKNLRLQPWNPTVWQASETYTQPQVLFDFKALWADGGPSCTTIAQGGETCLFAINTHSKSSNFDPRATLTVSPQKQSQKDTGARPMLRRPWLFRSKSQRVGTLWKRSISSELRYSRPPNKASSKRL